MAARSFAASLVCIVMGVLNLLVGQYDSAMTLLTGAIIISGLEPSDIAIRKHDEEAGR